MNKSPYTVNKFLKIEELSDWRRTAPNPVVFTNGCFDVLHVGHLRYLQQARALGECLVVGVNSDTSVRQLKGPTRPLNGLMERMEMLAGLNCVDWVVPLFEVRNSDLMTRVHPNIWAKGGDYTLEKLDKGERETALKLGVQIEILPLSVGFSTTSMLAKI